ncbi:MAG: formylglycine-generating enzyme family protein [Prevotellaceae bacterium]|jgi:formylglycine-generating enzyme required for sulfatase activity|nr:formylglycine-generating enzyme family protein [Prevotellaceae bacterium]
MKKQLLSILALLPLLAAILVQPACGGSDDNNDAEEEFLEFEPVLISVEGGTFEMGYKKGRDGEDNSDVSGAKPLHSVTVSSFRIGKYEVTQAQWEAVMGSNPSSFKKGGSYPMEMVSWDSVQAYLTKLNALTGKSYRLPTEAEWEYAARGGSKSKGYLYSGSSKIDDVAWYFDHIGNPMPAVGEKAPNELGIYDMTGNVWEWCNDWYGNYSAEVATNPTGHEAGSYRVLRGGGWDSPAAYCRVSYRNGGIPGYGIAGLGFRVALP